MDERVLHGRSIVGGSVMGRLVTLGPDSHEVFRVALEPHQIDAEIERLRTAVAGTGKELERARRQVADLAGERLAAIFDAQHLLLKDPDLQNRVEKRVAEEKVNAEWALEETLRALLERFSQLESDHLRQRADDLRDVGRALQRALAGNAPQTVERLKTGEPIVVLAHDLTPSETIRLSRAGVLGFGLEVGGQTSHTAIIARSLDLPLVAGLSAELIAVPEASQAIVDGDRGLVVLDPGDATRRRYQIFWERSSRREAQDLSDAALESRTVDGAAVELMANIDLPDEFPDVGRFGARGVGLYRSEFLFIESSPALPSEEEQLAVLEGLLSAAAPHPAVVRTFDLGGRKLAQEVIETHESNPVLGLRGIRLTLQRRDIFKSQVRAILRAGAVGRLRVLLPMVTAIEEILEFRAFVDECAAELEAEGRPYRTDFKLGSMIEVPAAAMIADRIARHVDFLSLGTNDLIQYSMAVDRSNEHVAYLYQPFHPAILRMVRFVVDAAREAGVEVLVCGEVAADPEATGLLLGLGTQAAFHDSSSHPRDQATHTLVRGGTRCRGRRAVPAGGFCRRGPGDRAPVRPARPRLPGRPRSLGGAQEG